MILMITKYDQLKFTYSATCCYSVGTAPGDYKLF